MMVEHDDKQCDDGTPTVERRLTPHTEARLTFHKSQYRLLTLLQFFHEKSFSVKPADLTLEQWSKIGSGEITFEDAFGEHGATIRELIVCRMVDNFETYLSHLLRIVIKKYPQMLPQSSVDLKDVLKHEQVSSFINELAETKAAQLTRQSLDDLAQQLRKHGFELFSYKTQAGVLKVMIQLRHLFVHNAGIIDRQFKKKVPFYPGRVGEPIEVEADYLMETLRITELLVVDIDSRAIKKWNLPSTDAEGVALIDSVSFGAVREFAPS